MTEETTAAAPSYYSFSPSCSPPPPPPPPLPPRPLPLRTPALPVAANPVGRDARFWEEECSETRELCLDRDPVAAPATPTPSPSPGAARYDAAGAAVEDVYQARGLEEASENPHPSRPEVEDRKVAEDQDPRAGSPEDRGRPGRWISVSVDRGYRSGGNRVCQYLSPQLSRVENSYAACESTSTERAR